jgi:DNA processing protein
MALQQVPLVGPKKARELISHCGSAEQVFKSKKSDLIQIPNIGLIGAEKILKFKDFKKAEKELKFIDKNDIQVFTYLDKDYPYRLNQQSDSPLILYKKGNADLNPKRSVAIVGTRKATVKGKMICEELVNGLKEYDATVVSGLAFGIDITAHRKCLDEQIPTIGVLAHGLDRFYPSQHKSTAKKMLHEGGLITEYRSETNPDRQNFPSRNRIIAGICDAIIVVESKQSGGSIITAKIANAYNKDVFAVPGRLEDEHSKGCNWLIKTHQAALIESATDIGYIMRWEKTNEQKGGVQKNIFAGLNEEEQKIVALLRTEETVSSNKITHELKMSIGKLAGLMLEMEFKGIVKALPGSRFSLVR